jgi:broad specificity phosphatase PhoE
MLALYITHPEVMIDPLVPVPEWGLSDVGRQRAALAASMPWAARLARIFTSVETKAAETADILAKAAGIRPETLEGSHENDRSATGFLPPAAFETAADWFFAHPQESYHGWERAIDAQARIVAAIDKALAGHDPARPVAFVGHGGVGTLLKCHLARTGIDRAHDQKGKGGNLFVFDLVQRRLACDWTAFETWKGLGS